MERAVAAARKTLEAARTVAGEAVTSLAEAQTEAAEAEAAVEARGTPRGLRRLVGRRGRRRLREALEAASEEAAQAGPHVEGPSWQCRSSLPWPPGADSTGSWLRSYVPYHHYDYHGRRQRTRRWQAKA